MHNSFVFVLQVQRHSVGLGPQFHWHHLLGTLCKVFDGNTVQEDFGFSVGIRIT